jgi:hypothetical protein
MVRNESVIFGRHIDIEVSYKILELEVPKLVPILHFRLAFKRGCLEAILSKNTLRLLGVKFVSNSFFLSSHTHSYLLIFLKYKNQVFNSLLLDIIKLHKLRKKHIFIENSKKMKFQAKEGF